MARIKPAIKIRVIGLVTYLSLLLISANSVAQAQNPYDSGTPAEAKGGASWYSAYAPDKLENVNLANGNFMVNIPLATVGGRGSASYTVSLSYHNKLWTSQHYPVTITDPLGGSTIIHHFIPRYGDGVETMPNEITLGGGWFILKAPAIKARKFGIEARRNPPHPGWFKYVLTKLWVVLPDGSEIELRDEATQGAPALAPQPDPVNNPLTDRDRGRVWKSIDGSAITYISDNNISGDNLQLSGWVFLPDGTRFRMVDISSGSYAARCTRITDRNGNYLDIAYDTPTTGAVTYTDQLGRKVELQGGTGGATVKIKGYNGLADRVYTVETARIGATDGAGNPINLRSDYWSVQRPIIAGDYFQSLSGTIEHTYTEPHTDLFYHGENMFIIDDIVTPTKLIMPDGRFFTFRYDKYGSVAEIIYPGGGKTQIDYAGGPSEVCEVLSSPFASEVNRKVSQRRVLNNGSTVDAVWLYNIGYDLSPVSSFEVRQGSGTGTLLASGTHYFMALNDEYRRCYSFGNDAVDYGSDGTMNMKWQNAKEFKVERQTGSGILTETKNWVQRALVIWANDPNSGVNAYAVQYGQEQPSNGDRITQADSILENGKLKRVEYGYSPDEFNNVTLVKEYDYGTNPNPGPVVRETTRSYATSLNGSCYSNLNPSDPNCGAGIATNINSIIHLRRLPLQESVWTANQTSEEARTVYEYDVYTNDGDHAGLDNYGGATVTGHDSLWASTRHTRGNVTRIGNWLKVTGTYHYSYPRYDKLGNVVANKDPEGNLSSISYADDYGNGDNPGGGVSGNFGATFAFPTLFTSPPPNPGEPVHIARAQYNFSRGTQTGFKDRNNIITKTEYNDLFNRPTKAIAGKGIADVETQTSFYYAPNNVYGITLNRNDVMVVSDRDATGDALLRSWTLTDGFGRTLENWTRHPQGDVKVSTIYDPLGRVKQQSNPYRSGETANNTTINYDLAGRVTSVVTPDGAMVTTVYDGQKVMVKDQKAPAANQARRVSETDGLGRLIKVWELTGAGTDTVTFSGVNYSSYLTQYTYDVLDNLKIVAQGGQTRTFDYDSLKRLTAATNPESGLVSYTYDKNNNLKTKTDARNITTTLLYDAFNRVKTKSYTDGTPAVSYLYDGQSFPTGAPAGFNRGFATGHLVALNYSNGSQGDYFGYDELGRVVRKTQQIGTVNYPITTTYNRASAMLSETYPSNRYVNYSYDLAGRTASVTGTLGDGSLRNYATGISYTAAGLLTQEQFGATTPLTHRLSYNNRQQLYDIRLGNDVGPYGTENRGRLKLYYGTNPVAFGDDGTNNNGNVWRAEHVVPLDDAVSSWVDSVSYYNYDELNRLTSVDELPVASWVGTPPNNLGWLPQAFSQRYNYDRFGNRTLNTVGTWGIGINRKAFAMDPANNNRLTVPSGQTGVMSYDAVGNLTRDTWSGNVFARLSYDAENRVKTAKNDSETITYGSYTYDGEGKRVKRVSNDVETWQVYGIGGELLAEYPVNGAAGSPQKEYGYRNGQLLIVAEVTGRKWLVADHLGTPRMVVDGTGSLGGIKRHDYLPFGEELGAGMGVRSVSSGYGAMQPQQPRQQFTGYERDNETGLDFAQARYFSSVQGRFTSPDVFGGRLTNPQTLNLYAYVLNNPLKWADPTGHFQEKPKDDPYRNDPCGGQPCEAFDRSSVADTIVTSESYVKFTTSLVPIYGSYLQADFEFQTGHPIKGTFYTAMAISDIAMVKSLFVAGGKLGLKAFGKVAGDETTELIIKDTLVETGVKIGDDAVPTFINLGDNAEGTVLGNLSVSPNGYLLPSGELANGAFDFVVQGGNVRVGRGHAALSQGAPVTWAGEIRFQDGAVLEWTNASGHFRPAAAFAGNAGLPMGSFRAVPFPVMVGGPQFPVFR